MNIPHNIRDQIDDIIDSVDFTTIKKAMDALNWTYINPNAIDPCVPTEYELRQLARRLLTEVCIMWKDNGCNTDGCYIASTGGFTAEINDNQLSLRFTIDEYTIDLKEMDNDND